MIVRLFLVILIGTAPWSARAFDQPACRDSSMRQAEDQSRPFQDRRTAYEAAIRACPREPQLYAGISALLLEHQEAPAALAWIKRGLHVAPRDPSLLTYHGVALLSAGEPEAALVALKDASPTPRTWFYLGMTYRALRDPKHSAEALRRAFESGYDDPYVLYVLIEQDRELRDKEAGLADFRMFSQKFPNSPWLHMLYGNAYLARNENSQAADEYAQAAKLDPKLPIVHYQLGFIWLDRGKYAEAADDFREEIRLNPTFAQAYLYLGTALRGLGKNQEAIPYLQEAVRRDPNYALAFRSLAAAEIAANQSQAAVRTLRSASRRFPQEPAFPAQLASLLRRLGRVQEAKLESEKAQTLSQKNNPVRDRADRAGGAARNGVTDNPMKSGSQQVGEGEISPLRNENGGSLTSPAARDPNALDPKLRPLYHCIARSDKACSVAALAAVKGPVTATSDYLELEARTYALTRQRDPALAVIGKAIAANPKQYRYRLAEGQIYQTFNDQVSAIRSFLLADQLQPKTSDTFYFLGLSFFFLEEYPRALKHLERAIELDAANHRAPFMMGVIESITFKSAEAKRYFEQAIKLDPRNPFYHLHYGILLGRAGDQAGAIREVEKAEALDSSYALTHYNLGHLYKDAGKYQEAKTELEAAVRLKPSLSAAYYQLGWVYHRLGMEPESRKAYEEFQKASIERKHETADPVESNLLPNDGSKE